MNGWRTTFDRGTAFIEGPKAEARRRIAACGDQSPVWVSRRGAWATSPAVANAVLDQLEGRRVPVLLDDTAQTGFDLSQTEPANVTGARQGELW